MSLALSYMKINDLLTVKIVECGWQVDLLVDDDGHLNVYIINTVDNNVQETTSDLGEAFSPDDELQLRFTTPYIENLKLGGE